VFLAFGRPGLARVGFPLFPLGNCSIC